MKKILPVLAVIGAVLFAVPAGAQTARIEFPGDSATSFVSITASMRGAFGVLMPIAFVGKLGIDTSCPFRRILLSAPLNTRSCNAVSFDIDHRTIVRGADPHAWECLGTTMRLVDAATGDTLPGCTRYLTWYAFKLDVANSDTATFTHCTIMLPSGVPPTIQLRLSAASFLMSRRPILTTIAVDGTESRSSLEMH